jgi:hypothetical protein
MPKQFKHQNKISLILCLVFFISCSYNKAVIENASVDVAKPPGIYGNATMLKPGINHSILLEYSAGNNNAFIPLSGQVKVNGEIQTEETNISYRLIDKILGLQYFFTSKADESLSNFYGRGGLGFQKFPYIFVSFGTNREHFEIGTAFLLGFSTQFINYDGYYVNEDGVWQEDINDRIRHCSTHMGTYLYASVYFQRFALNYVTSISNSVNNEVYENCDSFLSRPLFYFDFPSLLMQDFGIAYTNNHIMYRIGLNQITGIHFPGQYYRTTFQVAWLF